MTALRDRSADKRSPSLLGRSVCVSAVSALSLLLMGCADGLNFRADQSFEITTPEDGGLVVSPLQVSWELRSPRPEIKGWAVFVDRAPQPPKKSIEYFAEDNRRNIFIVQSQSTEIPAIEPRLGVAKGQRDRHRITVVPLDDQGRRIGESSKNVEFTVFDEAPLEDAPLEDASLEDASLEDAS